jgi:hypothetical protein
LSIRLMEQEYTAYEWNDQEMEGAASIHTLVFKVV